MRTLLALLVVLAGCATKTSIVVRVSDDGLAIPADIATVRITVDNPDLAGSQPVYESAELPLCGANVTAACYSLPLPVTLRPGASHPEASVRVLVVASSPSGTVVTSDAAIIGFTQGQKLQLDFVLSPRCLNTNCALQGRTCGASGACEGIVASTEPADLSVAPATSLPIERVTVDHGNSSTVGPPRAPQNTMTGDVVILQLGNRAHLAEETGWHVTQLENDSFYWRRADPDEATASAHYRVQSITSSAYPWILLAYRNVDQVVLGGASSIQPFNAPSYAVPVGGALSVTLLPRSQAAQCEVTDATGQPAASSKSFVLFNGSFEEWGPLPAGPSGAHTITCTVDGTSLQHWLIPR